MYFIRRAFRRRFCFLTLFPLLVGIAAAQTASPYKLPVLTPRQKVALVIGNSDYQSVHKLKNPKNDARLIGDTLRSLGFQVIYRYDATQAAMDDAVQEFSKALGLNSLAFFFYAGHGLQIGGKNYLVPVDFNFQKGIGSLWEAGLALNRISAKSRMNIIVLDSCRNSSDEIYKKLNGLAGFSEFRNTPDGTFIAFSTSPGKTAADGAGDHSPYATMLAESLRWSPAQLEQVFMYTQLRVEEATGGNQVPWRNSSTKALFFFTPDAAAFAPYDALSQNRLQKDPAASLPGVAMEQFEFSVPSLNETGTIIGLNKGTGSRFVERDGIPQIEMVRIDGGRFLMGASEAETASALADAKKFDDFDSETYEVLSAELPRHTVSVGDFYIGRYEISQAQYLAVMGELPPIPASMLDPNMPVTNVTWTEANEFCSRLSRATGRLYRLPSEAEWEYAARAGTDTPFAFGDTLSPQVASYNWGIPYGKALRGTRRNGPVPVGALNSTNAFGIQDMHGNVWEWCADYWHSDYDRAPVNGKSWDTAQAIASNDPDEKDLKDTSRVARGGSWFSPASRCRSASRYRYSPGTRANTLGFRIVVQ